MARVESGRGSWHEAWRRQRLGTSGSAPADGSVQGHGGGDKRRRSSLARCTGGRAGRAGGFDDAADAVAARAAAVTGISDYR